MNQIAVLSDGGRDGRSGRPLPPATLAGLLVAVLAVALIAFFTYRSLETRERAVERVTRTLAAQQQLEALLSGMKDAETGQRGLLLTGDEPYLEPYTNARATLPGQLEVLRGLMADNPPQQRRLGTIEQLANEKLEELARTIELHRAGDQQAALAIVLY